MISRPRSIHIGHFALNAALLAALPIAAFAASAQAADPADELIGLINDYHRVARACNGEPTAATGPRAPVHIASRSASRTTRDGPMMSRPSLK